MSGEENRVKSNSRVKDLVKKFSSMEETKTERNFFKSIENGKKNRKNNEQLISIIQDRNNKDDLSKFRTIPFKKFQLQQVDEEKNFFNFRFNIQMPKNQNNKQFSPLNKIELTLKEKEKNSQIDELSSVSDSKSSLATDSNTSYTNLEESTTTDQSSHSSEEDKNIRKDLIEDEKGIGEFGYGLDNETDSEEVNEYYSSDFFRKTNKPVFDEETLSENKDTESVITAYNMNQIEEQKASVLLIKSSSSDSWVESKDPNVKIKKRPSSQEKLSSTFVPETGLEPIVNKPFDQYQNNGEPICQANQMDIEQKLDKKLDKNGKVYHEIVCSDYEIQDEQIKKINNNEEQQEQKKVEEKIHLMSHLNTCNQKGKDEIFEYLSENDNYVKLDDPKPTPKVTINHLKEIQSAVKQNTEVQKQDNNYSRTNIIDIPEMMSHFYNTTSEEFDWGLVKNCYFTDDKNNTICLTECLKSNIEAIKNSSKKFVLFCTGIFKEDKNPICFEQIFEYVSVNFHDLSSHEDIFKRIKHTIEHLDSIIEKNMNTFHPIDYIKENLVERKSSTFLRHHSVVGVNRDILLGFEDDQNSDKINWVFHNSLLTTSLLKRLAENKHKLFIVLVKAREKYLGFDQVLKRSKQPCEIYHHKEFQDNAESRILTHLSFNQLSTQQQFQTVPNDQTLVLSDRQTLQNIPDESKQSSKITPSSLSIQALDSVTIEPNSDLLAESLQLSDDFSPHILLLGEKMCTNFVKSTPNENDPSFDKYLISDNTKQQNLNPQMDIPSFDHPRLFINEPDNNKANETTASNQDQQVISLKSPTSPRRIHEMDKRCEKSTPTNMLSREQLRQLKESSSSQEKSEKIHNLIKTIQTK